MKMLTGPIVSIALSQLCDHSVGAHLCSHGPELANEYKHT